MLRRPLSSSAIPVVLILVLGGASARADFSYSSTVDTSGGDTYGNHNLLQMDGVSTYSTSGDGSINIASLTNTVADSDTHHVLFGGSVDTTITDLASGDMKTVHVFYGIDAMLDQNSTTFAAPPNAPYLLIDPSVFTLGDTEYTLSNPRLAPPGAKNPHLVIDVHTRHVPEPTSLALMGIGLLGVAARRRARSRRAGTARRI